MKKGLLIIFSGPSGVGKGTLRSYFASDPDLNLTYSISMTTRQPRGQEVNGKDYIFVSKDEFKKAIDEGKLLEWAEFVGNYYGTPLAEVEKLRQEGKNVLLEIEVEGAKQVQAKCKDSISIFVIPPSMEELESRIRNRSSEPSEVIQRRLEKAKKEMELLHQYQYVVCNDDPQLAAKTVADIVKKHMNK